MTTIVRRLRALYTCPRAGGADELGAVHEAAMICVGGRICWLGKDSDWQQALAALPAEQQSSHRIIDGRGEMIGMPGLVDCHTHLAFGGWRSDEFSLKCQGATYQEIAARGGGILSTMAKTRAATEVELLQTASQRLNAMRCLGTTAVEAKSGYGLSFEEELKLLRVYRQLATQGSQLLVGTLLAAHVVPPEYRSRRESYIRMICDELIPQVAEAKLAQFCDVFVEEGAFSVAEARMILEVGKRYGLQPKLHVDQLCDGGGARLAAEVGAISADHLEFAANDGLKAMAEAQVIAVTLPIASLYLRQPPLDARRCLERGLKVAVATDFNPGSAPSYDLRFAMLLACVMNRLTPAQALRAATIHAAEAIGLAAEVGSLETGKRADFLLLDVESIEQWLYHFVPNVTSCVYIAGEHTEDSPCPST